MRGGIPIVIGSMIHIRRGGWELKSPKREIIKWRGSSVG